MRYRASEKLEIIRLVEQSHLGVGSTLDKLGIPKTTFYRWYDRFLAFGDAGLEDRNSSPGRVWNRIPDDVRGQIIDLALEETQLSPREPAVRFTDTRGYFVSEASVYRLLQAHDLITSRSTCGYDGQGSRLAHIPTGSTTATGCDKKDFGSMIKQRKTP